jgi:hypothetical protein
VFAVALASTVGIREGAGERAACAQGLHLRRAAALQAVKDSEARTGRHRDGLAWLSGARRSQLGQNEPAVRRSRAQRRTVMAPFAPVPYARIEARYLLESTRLGHVDDALGGCRRRARRHTAKRLEADEAFAKLRGDALPRGRPIGR